MESGDLFSIYNMHIAQIQVSQCGKNHWLVNLTDKIPQFNMNTNTKKITKCKNNKKNIKSKRTKKGMREM